MIKRYALQYTDLEQEHEEIMEDKSGPYVLLDDLRPLIDAISADYDGVVLLNAPARAAFDQLVALARLDPLPERFDKIPTNPNWTPRPR